MSKPMSFGQLTELLSHALEEHSPAQMGQGRRTVKYVDPHVDLRDGKVFSVTFRGFGWTSVIHTQNECRDLPKSLFERCMEFLDGKE